MIWFVAYLATIVAANWAVASIGVVPVGFGLMAPAAVYFVGLAFTLRDLLHEAKGPRYVIVAILGGVVLSALFSPAFAVASGAAFFVSELMDFAVYTPLRKRNFLGAVLASNVVGLVLDSIVFLAIAFGSMEFLMGQIVGKAWMTLLALPILWAVRNAVFERQRT